MNYGSILSFLFFASIDLLSYVYTYRKVIFTNNAYFTNLALYALNYIFMIPCVYLYRLKILRGKNVRA